MGEEKEIVTIEVPEVITEPIEAKPTVDELTEEGFAPEEIEAAENQGLTHKEGDPEPKEKGDPPPPDFSGRKEEKEGDGKDKNQVNELAFDPEKDEEKTKAFNKNEKGLYWSTIKDRKKRQSAESERDRVKIESKAHSDRADRLEAELAEAKKTPPEHVDPLFDDDGNELPPAESKEKTKFLTEEDLQKREADAADKLKDNEGKLSDKRKAVNETLDIHEAEARAKYEDFDNNLDFAKDVMTHANAGKLEELFPSKIERLGVQSLIQDFFLRLSRADEVPEGQQTSADVGYEIGKLHPRYGKDITPGKKGDEHGKPKGDPDKFRRTLENSSRRSSANLTGGASTRAVSLDELTAEDIAKFPQEKYNALRRDHPEVIKRILEES